MQASLPAEATARNIEAADIAVSAEVAKVVETTALQKDARQHPRLMPLILRSRETRPRDQNGPPPMPLNPPRRAMIRMIVPILIERRLSVMPE